MVRLHTLKSFVELSDKYVLKDITPLYEKTYSNIG